jgi:hypothetical protein
VQFTIPGPGAFTSRDFLSLTYFEVRGPNRFRQIGEVSTSFHAVNGIVCPNGIDIMAVNHHENAEAEVP